MTVPEREGRITDLEALKVLSDPFRQRVLTSLADQPATVKQTAERLGVPPHKLYYHVKLLEQHGLIRVVETRVVQGIIEKHFQATARRFSVDPELLAPGNNGGAASTLDTLIQILLLQNADALRRNVASGRIDLTREPPHPDSVLGVNLFMEMDPDDVEAVYGLLQSLPEQIERAGSSAAAAEDAEKPTGKRRLTYAMTVLLYPTEFTPSPEENDDD